MSALESIRGGWKSIVDELGSVSPVEMAPRLTILLVILYSYAERDLRSALVMACGAALIFRAVLTNPWFWSLISVVMAWGTLRNWYTVDNHKYLMAYWCLALTCAFLHSSPLLVIQRNGRLLIGLCFLFATVWKLMSDSYVNGAFYSFALVSDPYCLPLVKAAGLLSTTDAAANATAIRSILRPDMPMTEVNVVVPQSVSALAWVITWWCLIIDALIAAAFLLKKPRWLSDSRNLLLIVFGLTTYAIANVIGFGWLLMILGLSQCEKEEIKARVGYVVTFFVIQLYAIRASLL